MIHYLVKYMSMRYAYIFISFIEAVKCKRRMTKTSKRQFEMSSWPTIQTAAVSLKLGRSQSSSTMHYIISINAAESSPKKSYNSCRKETATTTASFLKPNYWHFSESYWKSMFRSDRIEPPHRDPSHSLTNHRRHN